MTPVLLINAKLREKMTKLMYFRRKLSALQSNRYFLRLQLWLQMKCGPTEKKAIEEGIGFYLLDFNP